VRLLIVVSLMGTLMLWERITELSRAVIMWMHLNVFISVPVGFAPERLIHTGDVSQSAHWIEDKAIWP
jgi:hypothetical protein